jgi:uncharacterized protein YggE
MKAPTDALRFLIPLTLLLLSFQPGHADTAIITVSGHAAQTVLTDELRITLEMSTESATFAGAKGEADAVANRIRSELATVHSGFIHVSTHIQVLKQKKISWSSKAKKLTHSFDVTLRDIDQNLPELAASIVDTVLKLDSRLAVSDLVGVISDIKQAEVRSNLLATAVQDARSSATVLAAEADLEVLRPKAIHVTPGYVPYGHNVYDSFAPGIAEAVSINRGFTVYGALVDEQQVSVNLVVEFETRPAN